MPKAVGIAVLLTALVRGAVASTGGQAGVEATGFFKHSETRPDSSTVLALEPVFTSDGAWLTGRLSPRAMLFTSDPAGSLTLDLGDTYLATSLELMPHHQVSFGRKGIPWSETDRVWNLGIWSSRFSWDPLRPRLDGLTGLFYEYRSKYWKVTAFASPVSIPDRSFPIRTEGGRLFSPSPDFAPPYRNVVVETVNSEAELPIRYSIAMPPAQDLVFNSGAGARVRFGEDEGAWIQASAASLPSHQLDLAAEFRLDPQTLNVNTVIHPRVYRHGLLTAELGYSSPAQSNGIRWSTWVSATRERPEQLTGPSAWISQPIGPAWIGSSGATLGVRNWFWLSASILAIQEEKPAPNEDQAALTLPSRFAFTRASRVNLTWDQSERLRPELQWTHDYGFPANHVSFDLTYRLKAASWLIGLGGDAFFSNLGQGYFGSYAGNERVRGRVAYVF